MMSIEVTEDAAEVLRRSLELTKVDPASGGVRLRGSHGLGGGFDIQVEMAEGPLEGEETVRCGDLNLFVDPAVRTAMPNAVVALEPQHETLVVRPAEPA
jgi:uncharacterized protein YneR